MVTLKEAKKGEGFILRFREIARRGGEAEIRPPTFRVGEAQVCNGVKDNQRRLALADNAVPCPTSFLRSRRCGCRLNRP